MGVLDGKSAIVTGSARGIGRATAELLASEGAQVLINDLDSDLAEEDCEGDLRRDRGLRRRPHQGRRGRSAREERRRRVRQDRHHRQQRGLHARRGHPQDDRRAVPGDARHPPVVPFRIVRAAAPYFRDPAKKEREEGKEVFRKIVNVSSTSGTFGNAGQANYSAAKAGVVGLTKTLAKEWGQFKVNVNAVAFGFIETRLTAAKERGERDRGRAARRSSSGSPSRCASRLDADPARTPGHARGGRGRHLPALLAVGQLHPRPDAPRHGRHVRRDVGRLAGGRAGVAAPPPRSRSPARARRLARSCQGRSGGRGAARSPAGAPRRAALLADAAAARPFDPSPEAPRTSRESRRAPRLRPPAADRASGRRRCSQTIGSAYCTVTFGNCRRFQLRTREEPNTAIGTTGTPVSSARRPMPRLACAAYCPVRERPPSGYISTAAPLDRAGSWR